MARSRKEDTKTKAERLQTILRLVQEHPISRQEVLLEHLRRNTPILATIAETQKWDDDTANAVVAEIGKVKQQFKTSSQQAPVGEGESKSLGDDDVDAEKIVVQKR